MHWRLSDIQKYGVRSPSRGARVPFPEGIREVLPPDIKLRVGARSQPFAEYKKAPARRPHRTQLADASVAGKRAIRHILFDTNYWKSFVHARLAVAIGDRGCLSLFGTSPDQHRLFAEHLTAEYRVATHGRGRTVEEWKQRPERSDNHWFDCLVGCAAGASIQGATLANTGGATRTLTRERISFSELQRRKRL